MGPDGVTPYYDTLTVDQSLLTNGDVGTHTVTMRVFQDPAVDGYTNPTAGYITGEVLYYIGVFVSAIEVCPSTLGPYQVTNPAYLVYDHEQLYYSTDPDTKLTEIYYCQHVSTTGVTSVNVRGWTATFTNSFDGT